MRVISIVTRQLQPVRNFSAMVESRTKLRFDLPKTYEEAVETLNTLQTPASFRDHKQWSLESDRRKKQNVPETFAFLNHLGISMKDIDSTRAIHITGTKGKGSTCAFTESILRNHGFKTGFFSSPHLIEVRERIRINGKPLSRNLFAQHFWECYQAMEKAKAENVIQPPPYFRFLTAMAFKVFIAEKVDVAIIEVGIGGEYDSTNIMRNPVVCAITSLGLDHTSILGNTINEIAWQKAGIIKRGCPVVTVPQPDKSVEVIIDRGINEKKTNVFEVPSCLSSYTTSDNEPKHLGIGGEVQELNASVALQISKIWLETHSLPVEERTSKFSQDCKFQQLNGFNLTKPFLNGLAETKWFGRSQILKQDQVTFYIDGAHTPRSIDTCARWFENQIALEVKELPKDCNVKRILIFNVTGDRQAEPLLARLQMLGFRYALFSTNICKTIDADIKNLTVSESTIHSICQKNLESWKKVNGNELFDNAKTYNSINEALYFLEKIIKEDCSQSVHYQVLVTGSLHLAGGLLKLRAPNLLDSYE